MRVVHLQHVSFENMGSIEPWLRARDHEVRHFRMFAGDPLPTLDEFDVLIVMGGPMGVNDEAEFPWLADEKRLVRAAIEAGKKVLGVCLGSQLIASALGARVYPNGEREIGWFEIVRTPDAAGHPLGAVLPERAVIFHWHGDTLDLPAGATHLASSAGCRHQAFAVGDHVLALQFHFEMSPAGAAELIHHCRNELVAGPYIASREQIAATPERFTAMNQYMDAVLQRLLGA